MPFDDFWYKKASRFLFHQQLIEIGREKREREREKKLENLGIFFSKVKYCSLDCL